jgi:hypothetical protein
MNNNFYYFIIFLVIPLGYCLYKCIKSYYLNNFIYLHNDSSYLTAPISEDYYALSIND